MLLMTFAGFACSRANPNPEDVPEPAADRVADPTDLVADAVVGPTDLAPERGADATDLAPGAVSRTAVLAGGCFWCTEVVFEQLEGVTGVVSGYAGGSAESANYPAVSSGATEHAEAIAVTYDPARISYGEILKIFFTVAHDPTQVDRQGPDRGRQYRSAVFFADADEKAAAEAYIKRLEEAKVFNRPIATKLEPLEKFYPAEDDHQDYVVHNPNDPYVAINALPKVRKVREKFADQVRPTP